MVTIAASIEETLGFIFSRIDTIISSGFSIVGVLGRREVLPWEPCYPDRLNLDLFFADYLKG